MTTQANIYTLDNIVTHTRYSHMVSARLNCLLMTWSMLLWRQRKISTG